jgi:HSP20 family protein
MDDSGGDVTMAMIRWNPTGELLSLHSDLDRVFNALTEGLQDAAAGSPREGQAFLPIDIKRRDDALEIEASLPGFRPEEVALTVDQGVLTIDARHQEERKEEKESYVRRERFAGRLFRQVTLGDGIDGDNIRAVFSDGILKLKVPLLQKTQPRRIPVAAGELPSGKGSGGPQKVATTQHAEHNNKQPVGASA